MKTDSRTFPIRHLLAVAVLSALSLQAHAVVGVPAITSAYVFGDSLSDGGNNFLAIGGAPGQTITGNSYIPTFPYASGVYSNGPVWFNSFTAGLGLAAFGAPSLAGGGGGNYAYGGARTTAEGTGPGGFPPSLPTQLNAFLTNGPGVSSTALYVIAGGGNDVRDVGAAIALGADPTATIAAAATAYATKTAQMVGALKAAGATASNIVVWNVPNVGLAPASLASGPAAAGGASFIASTLNGALAGALATSGARIFDLYGLITTVVAAPAAYGLTNVVDACGFAGNSCDPATALFWDGIHPTAAGQLLVGNAMLAAVPEPGAVWMFMAGLVGLGALRLRRS